MNERYTREMRRLETYIRKEFPEGQEAFAFLIMLASQQAIFIETLGKKSEFKQYSDSLKVNHGAI